MVHSISSGSSAEYGVPAGIDPASSGSSPLTVECIRWTAASTRSASGFVPKKISSNILPVAASRRNGRDACRVWVRVPTKFRGSIAPIARARCPYMRPTAGSQWTFRSIDSGREVAVFGHLTGLAVR